MAIDLASPAINTVEHPSGQNGSYDQYTVQLRDQMNAVIAYPPTIPPTFPAYVRYPGLGIYEEQYSNVGWHHLPVASGTVSSIEIGRFESPEIPVTHLSYAQSIFNSTMMQSQQAGRRIYTALRAPGINEGF